VGRPGSTTGPAGSVRGCREPARGSLRSWRRTTRRSSRRRHRCQGCWQSRPRWARTSEHLPAPATVSRRRRRHRPEAHPGPAPATAVRSRSPRRRAFPGPIARSGGRASLSMRRWRCLPRFSRVAEHRRTRPTTSSGGPRRIGRDRSPAATATERGDSCCAACNRCAAARLPRRAPGAARSPVGHNGSRRRCSRQWQHDRRRSHRPTTTRTCPVPRPRFALAAAQQPTW
jgi:hypothetical protein